MFKSIGNSGQAQGSAECMRSVVGVCFVVGCVVCGNRETDRLRFSL